MTFDAYCESSWKTEAPPEPKGRRTFNTRDFRPVHHRSVQAARSPKAPVERTPVEPSPAAAPTTPKDQEHHTHAASPAHDDCKCGSCHSAAASAAAPVEAAPAPAPVVAAPPPAAVPAPTAAAISPIFIRAAAPAPIAAPVLDQAFIPSLPTEEPALDPSSAEERKHMLLAAWQKYRQRRGFYCIAFLTGALLWAMTIRHLWPAIGYWSVLIGFFSFFIVLMAGKMHLVSFLCPRCGDPFFARSEWERIRIAWTVECRCAICGLSKHEIKTGTLDAG